MSRSSKGPKSGSESGVEGGRRPLTRRSFLQMVGAVGGATAVYETMVAMGLLRAETAWAGPPRLQEGMGRGIDVAILGAGIGGLTAAYELLEAGFNCEILEAQDRVGGRSLTARNGTVITEVSAEHGTTQQTCRFDEGLYLNMGPGRLPYHHRRALRYCDLLGVPLEVYVMTTTANRFQTPEAFGGEAVPRRRIQNDTRGYISELLAKAIRNDDLDLTLSDEDEERLLDLLRFFGDLSDKYRYRGSTRSGCRFPLSVHQACEPECPLPFADLLNSEFWQHRLYQPEEFEWQPTLFQPVGGMDEIVKGFERALAKYDTSSHKVIHRQAEVRKINLLTDSVEIEYFDRRANEMRTKTAHYCISNIPLPVLDKIPANFEKDFKAAIDSARFAPTCKVGWQANERFWENDDNQIYGGISYIDHNMTQMWYPSNDYFTRKGTLTGAYNYGENAIALGRLELAARLRLARQGAIRLHEQFRDDAIVPEALGLSIAWQNIPFIEGGWADWKPQDTAAYARLLAPDRRFHVVGDQVSTLPGWQEGAMMSAEHVIEQVAGLRVLTVPEIREAPNTRRLVEGLY